MNVPYPSIKYNIDLPRIFKESTMQTQVCMQKRVSVESNKWTPVNEAVPQNNGIEYFVTVCNQRGDKNIRWVSEAKYLQNDYWHWRMNYEDGEERFPEQDGWKVIAWMPKPLYPEPYRG
jgi:hypothetical protein